MLHSFFTHKAITKLCEGHIWGPSLYDQKYQWQSQYLSPNARLDTSLQGQRTRHEAIMPQVIIITYQQKKKKNTFVGTESKTTGSKAHCKHQPILSLQLGVFAKIQ